MYKIIGGDGKEYGPVAAEQLRQWIREGRANARTQALPVGGGEWKPLGELPEFADSFGSAVAAAVVSAIPVSAPRRECRLEIGDCFSRGWEFFKANTGLLIGAAAVVFLLIGVGSAIPYLGGIIGIIIDGPLLGGLWLVFLKRWRNQDASVSNAFDGFHLAFGQLILGHLVPSLLAFVWIIPGAICLAIGVVVHQKQAAAGIPLLAVGGLLLAAAVVVGTYLATCWALTVPLIADKGMTFWPAMKESRAIVRKQWWAWFGLFLLAGLLGVAGFLLCCVGALFTGPIAFAAITRAYEDACGTDTTPAA